VQIRIRVDRAAIDPCFGEPADAAADYDTRYLQHFSSYVSRDSRSGFQPCIVSNWRRRFADHGLGGLRDRPRAAKKPIYDKATNKRILALLDEPPPQGYAVDGCVADRSIGRRRSPVCPALLARALYRSCRPHILVREQYPEFVAKAADVVGLYAQGFLCVGEKPSIEALQRAQGYLNLRSGRAQPVGAMTTSGTAPRLCLQRSRSTPGKIIASHSKRRCRVEFLGFKNSVVAAFPDHELHVILDNLNTHKKNERRPIDPVVLAQLGRNSVFDPAAPINQLSNCRSTSMLSSQPTTRQPSHSLGRANGGFV
jgi:hypothetical protein